jgi:hypothetical protein
MPECLGDAVGDSLFRLLRLVELRHMFADCRPSRTPNRRGHEGQTIPYPADLGDKIPIVSY